tara:strand:+ start:311 stop:529 length:219 start_codon:yes stop_codon:yes gene_type:complete
MPATVKGTRSDIPTYSAVRKIDGAVVKIDHRIDNPDRYTRNGLAKAKRRGRQPLATAPLSEGEPLEFEGRIG